MLRESGASSTPRHLDFTAISLECWITRAGYDRNQGA